jgi:hypothetical protein
VSDAHAVPDVTDLTTARALIATLHDELTKAQRENASLRHQLDVLCQRLFGKKSERVDPRQLQLALAQLANEPGPVSEPVEMDRARRRSAAIRGAAPPAGDRSRHICLVTASRSTSPTSTNSARAATPRRASGNPSPRSSSSSRRVLS